MSAPEDQASYEGPNAAQEAFWTDAAQGWITNYGRVSDLIEPFGVMAMEGLGISGGERLLDIGCGTGATTLDLASRVGPGGHATGVDIAAPMIEAAAQSARERSISNVAFRHADAQSEDLSVHGPFDGAFSRFGVMFFADPSEAFKNVRKAMSAGGRLSFVCWQAMDANEWMHLPSSIVVEACGLDPVPATPGTPGPFSLSAPGMADEVLQKAGFSEVKVEPRFSALVIDEENIDRTVDRSLGTGSIRAMIASSGPEFAERARQALREGLRARMSNGRLELSAAVLVVSARS